MAKKSLTLTGLHKDLKIFFRFITSDIWSMRRKDLPGFRRFLIHLLRVSALTFRGLSEDRCQLRASSLTYYSLLSIVPVLAMAFGIAKGFGFENSLQKTLMERLAGQEEVAQRIIEFSHAMLDNVKGGLVAGVGIVILFYTIIKILSHIESAFNDIWGIKTPRSLTRKVTDYLSIMLICPVLFLVSSAATVIVTSGLKVIMDKIAILGAFSPVILSLLNFMPYCVLWILFTFLYMFMPNDKVRFSSALIAGIIAGTLYHLFQGAYIFFQVNVSKYNAIYGSFAAVPLFFIWLQFSWLIVLFGAEISFAHQNADTYEYEKECLSASHAFKRLLCLRVVHLLVSNFSTNKPPWTSLQISSHLGVPIRLIHQILFELVATGILTEAGVNGDRDKGFQPGRDPDTLTIKTVIDALDQNGTDTIPVVQSEELERLSMKLMDLGELVEASPANRLLKDI
jgi:membrane protein